MKKDTCRDDIQNKHRFLNHKLKIISLLQIKNRYILILFNLKKGKKSCHVLQHGSTLRIDT